MRRRASFLQVQLSRVGVIWELGLVGLPLCKAFCTHSIEDCLHAHNKPSHWSYDAGTKCGPAVWATLAVLAVLVVSLAIALLFGNFMFGLFKQDPALRFFVVSQSRRPCDHDSASATTASHLSIAWKADRRQKVAEWRRSATGVERAGRTSHRWLCSWRTGRTRPSRNSSFLLVTTSMRVRPLSPEMPPPPRTRHRSAAMGHDGYGPFQF